MLPRLPLPLFPAHVHCPPAAHAAHSRPFAHLVAEYTLQSVAPTSPLHLPPTTHRLQCVQRISNLTNYLVVAIDADLAAYCEQHNVPYYHRPVVIPDTQVID